MKRVSLFVACLTLCVLVIPATGADVTFDAQGMQVTVSDRLPPPIDAVPANCKEMTDAEWFSYVTAFNTGQRDAAGMRHKEALARGDYQPTTAHVASSKSGGTSTYKATDALGVPAVGVANAGYGGGGYSGFGALGGFGLGSGTGGGATSNTETSSSFEYDKMYKNLNDNGGGPVAQINPYCRDYWMKRAK